MALGQRIFLIIGSLVTLLYFISNIRKSKLKINHSIFWVIFGLVLLCLACIPGSAFLLSRFLGFQSPANLVYVIVIFLLVVKLFTTTVKLSKLSEQVTALTQELALHKTAGDEQLHRRTDTKEQDCMDCSV